MIILSQISISLTFELIHYTVYFSFLSEINIFNKLLIIRMPWYSLLVLKVPLNTNQPHVLGDGCGLGTVGLH